MQPDRVLVSATEAATLLTGLRVTRHAIAMWRQHGRIEPVANRGRSPLYRFSDLLSVERETRQSGRSNRARSDTPRPRGHDRV